MNTEPSLSSPAAAESQPDYKVAAQELATYFATLGLSATVHSLHADVDEPTEKGGEGWSHVAAKVTFHRLERRTSNSADFRPAVSVTFDYKLGLGLADWKRVRTHIAAKSGKTSNDYRDVEAMLAHKLNNADARALAGRYLWTFQAKVNPAEVLATVCRDGEDAVGQSFAEWAGNYGYDEDSRKALAIYELCQQNGDKARRLLSHAPGAVAKLADLSARL